MTPLEDYIDSIDEVCFSCPKIDCTYPKCRIIKPNLKYQYRKPPHIRKCKDVSENTFGYILRKARLNRNMNQSELAKKIGVTRQCVTAWEMNKTFPRHSILKAIKQLMPELE